MELWDAYDMNLNKIKDKTLIRGETVPDGMYHLVCEVIVKHTDGTYLLMQRDKNKHYGEYWEATAGGSALQGETQDYKWVDKDTLKNMKSNELVTRRMQLFIKELR